MENGRWRQVGDLFEAALERAPAERAAWVRAADVPPDVRDEVLSLIEAHESADTFLEQPASATAVDPPEPPEPELLAPGTLIGPYRITGVIGQGGMGVVYLAEDVRLHRPVAVKSLPARLARDERLRQRLRQEARAAAALMHPGIATVFALEELEDHVFIVSEYLRGDTLRAEMDRRRLSPAEVLSTALEIARAMAAAHERGIVHRDLKPENVLRTESGTLKILDFGLAQFEAPARDLASWTRLTEPGLVAGTPAYMAPEQLLARPTDARTDQFAFGIMLCELASGCHPFSGGSLPSTIARILTAEPQLPPDEQRAPPALWSIVDRCLKKAPADRFRSTGDLVQALEDVTRNIPSPGERVPTSAVEPRGTAKAVPSTNVRAAGSTTSHTAGAVPSADPRTGGGHHFSGAEINVNGAEIHSTGAAIREPDAAWWWRFHQLAAALIYWGMVWPAWHVRPWLGTPGLLWFLGLLACIIVAGNLRLHLWFSSRIYPSELRAQRSWVGMWVRSADWGFAALLVVGGLLLVQAHAGWGALLVAMGIGSIVAFAIIEPTTARAAFGDTTP